MEVASICFKGIKGKEKLFLTFIMHFGIHLMNTFLLQHIMQMQF